MSEELTLSPGVEDAGDRLDKWLAGQIPERSRAEIQRWIDGGLVALAGKRLKRSYRVSPGDRVTVIVPPVQDYAVAPEPIPLDILYEDGDLLVVNKPSGIVVHPAAGNWTGTLVNAVLYHCPNLEGVGGVHRPGIVHRLDKDTSGVILIAKNDAAHRALQAQFKERSVEKTYEALVHGRMDPAEGEVDAPIGRDPDRRHQMAVVASASGRPALTRYTAIGYYRARSPGADTRERYTLLACHPRTGRTHQIRVHMAYIRHPLVGDRVYSRERGHLQAECPRQFLHAARIRFRLPSTGQEVEFSATLPADLRTVLDALERED